MFYTPPPSGGGSGTLQTVTDAGNITTNVIYSPNFLASNGVVIGGQLRTQSGNFGELSMFDNNTNDTTTLRALWLEFVNPSGLGNRIGKLTFDTANINYGNTITWSFPYLNGNSGNHVLAPYTDPNGSLNYVGFYMNNGVNVYGSLAFDGVEGALELVNGAGFVSNLKTLATSARLNTLPDQDGTLAIKIYYEAQLQIERDAAGSITIASIYNDSPYTFTGTSPSANTITIAPSAAMGNVLLMVSSGLELIGGATLIPTNAFYNSPNIDITHDISATGIIKIQLNIKIII